MSKLSRWRVAIERPVQAASVGKANGRANPTPLVVVPTMNDRENAALRASEGVRSAIIAFHVERNAASEIPPRIPATMSQRVSVVKARISRIGLNRRAPKMSMTLRPLRSDTIPRGIALRTIVAPFAARASPTISAFTPKSRRNTPT
jgi:hypothetical protein